MIRLLLPSLASAPDHCAECDGPRDLPGPMCTDCVDAPLLQRLEWRYQNGEGITPLLDFESDYLHLTAGREFHPLHWRLAVDVEFSHMSVSIALALGPWSIWIGCSS